MRVFNLLICFKLVAMVSGDGLEAINYDGIKPSPNETRIHVDFLPEEFQNGNDEVLECGNEPVSVYDGSEFVIRNENFPNRAPIDTQCSFNVQAQPQVAIDIMCSKVDLPCHQQNFLDVKSSAAEKTASFCTKRGGQDFVRIQIAANDENVDLVISHRILGKKAGGGFNCVIRGLGGAQREDGPEERIEEGDAPVSIQSRSTGNCGRTRYTRIIGGGNSAKNEYPWMVHLALGRSLCGGSLINTNWILTAAHCSIGKSLRSIRAYLGCRSKGCSGNVRAMDRNVIHGSYNFPINDIALLRMSFPIARFSNTIQTVCLPSSARYRRPVGASLWVSGWGLTSGTSEQLPTILKEARVTMGRDKECFDKSNMPLFCARRGTGNTCRGDSGSPVVYPSTRNGIKRWVQYGIVSFGRADCPFNAATGHTEIPHFINWIVGIAGAAGSY